MAGIGGRQSLQHVALDEVAAICRISRREQVLAHVVQAGVAPRVVVVGRHLGEDRLGGDADVVDVALAGLGHAGKGVEQVEVAQVARFQQGEGGGHHRAAAPDAAFHDRARNVGLGEVADRVDQGADAVAAGHGEGGNPGDDLGVGRVEFQRMLRRWRLFDRALDGVAKRAGGLADAGLERADHGVSAIATGPGRSRLAVRASAARPRSARRPCGSRAGLSPRPRRGGPCWPPRRR